MYAQITLDVRTTFLLASAMLGKLCTPPITISSTIFLREPMTSPQSPRFTCASEIFAAGSARCQAHFAAVFELSRVVPSAANVRHKLPVTALVLDDAIRAGSVSRFVTS